MRILIIATFGLFFSGVAAADWQWTKWGMTEAEVIAAAPIPLNVGHDDGQNDKYKTHITFDYNAASFRYEGRFTFSRATGALERVVLTPLNGCNGTKMLLASRYGEPFSKSSFPGLMAETTWRDDENDNVVSFLEFNTGDCKLSYESPATADNNGL